MGDIAFSTMLLASLLREDVLKVWRRQLIPELWTNRRESEIAEAVLRCYDGAGKPPSLPVLVHVLVERRRWTLEDAKSVCQALQSLDVRGIESEIGEFIRKQRLQASIARASAALLGGDVDRAEAEMASQGSADPNRDEIRYLDDVADRLRGYARREDVDKITTGVSSVDEIMEGGLARGELGVVLAPPKRGKSTMLINFGRGALLAGYGVYHYTFELSGYAVVQRYDRCLTGLTKAELRDPERVEEVARILGKVRGALSVVEYAANHLSVRALFAEVRDAIKSGKGVDALIVDYGDLMLPGRRYEERRHELTDIYTTLRSIATTCKVAVWTASQISRAGAGRETATSIHVAECWDKIAVADAIVVMNQNVEESRRGVARLFFSELRDSEDRKQVMVRMDLQTCTVTGLGGCENE